MAVYNEKDKSKWTKDGRHWYFKVSYRDNKGKKRYYNSKRYKTRDETEDAERKYKTHKSHSTFVNFNIIADEYFEFISKIRKSSTVNSYKKDYNNHLKDYFEDYNINAINTAVIRNWIDEMNAKTISTNYKNKIYNILSNIFDYAIKYYDLETNVVKNMGRFQEKNDTIISDDKKLRYITFEEFTAFISVIDISLWKTFFTFAYYTGCRRGEIQALTWNDIDFSSNDITINKTLYEEIKGEIRITSTKNNLNRKIKMSKALKEALITYKKECEEYTDFQESWFVFGNSRFLPKTTITRYKDNYFTLSGVHRITMHEFRHSHVSLLINEYVKVSKEKNMKIDTAKFFLMMSDRMGHSIQVMQDTYMHLFPTIQDEIVDLLDNL